MFMIAGHLIVFHFCIVSIFKLVVFIYELLSEAEEDG
jgi:hypothetical protein